VSQIKPRATTSFSQIRRINTGLLNVGCVEAGPADGSAVIPCTAGYRVTVPYLRGPYDPLSFQ
jgi:hypothetical protein